MRRAAGPRQELRPDGPSVALSVAGSLHGMEGLVADPNLDLTPAAMLGGGARGAFGPSSPAPSGRVKFGSSPSPGRPATPAQGAGLPISLDGPVMLGEQGAGPRSRDAGLGLRVPPGRTA